MSLDKKTPWLRFELRYPCGNKLTGPFDQTFQKFVPGLRSVFADLRGTRLRHHGIVFLEKLDL